MVLIPFVYLYTNNGADQPVEHRTCMTVGQSICFLQENIDDYSLVSMFSLSGGSPDLCVAKKIESYSQHTENYI